MKLALRLALAREPAPDEIDRGVDFMRKLKEKYKLADDAALNQFALLVLNLNEFIFLD